ncbi:MAG: hypothetical protein J2O48_10700 [Solirubrobacterales bacterium]|nr:hypothetical protein [Solirubrobacterales bacterium]
MLATLAAVALITGVALAGVALAGLVNPAHRDSAERAYTINVPAYNPGARRMRANAHPHAHPSAKAHSSPGNAADAVLAQAKTARAVDNPKGGAQNVGGKPLTAAAGAQLNGASEWIPYWAVNSAVASATQNASQVKVAHPFWYQVDDSGKLEDQSGGQDGWAVNKLGQSHITVIPTVTEKLGMNDFAKLLGDKKKRGALVNQLAALGTQRGYAGIDLDFENIALGDRAQHGSAADAKGYPQFVNDLCQRLRAKGASCEVTVIAKNNAGQVGGGGLDTRVYDYAALAKAADRVQLMAYDDHYPGGSAGAIAPLPWVQSVLSYALSQVPASKLILGIPAYGYNWSTRGATGTLTSPAAEQLASQVGAKVSWDASQAEANFDYRTRVGTHTTTKTTTRRVKKRVKTTVKTTVKTKVTKKVKQKGKPDKTVTTVVPKTVTKPGTKVITVTQKVQTKTNHPVFAQHTVWFDNATADYDRAVLAANDHLAGVALWAAGDEDPSFWGMLSKLH